MSSGGGGCYPGGGYPPLPLKPSGGHHMCSWQAGSTQLTGMHSCFPMSWVFSPPPPTSRQVEVSCIMSQLSQQWTLCLLSVEWHSIIGGPSPFSQDPRTLVIFPKSSFPMIEHNLDSTKGTFFNYIRYAQAANNSATFIKFEVVMCKSRKVAFSLYSRVRELSISTLLS